MKSIGYEKYESIDPFRNSIHLQQSNGICSLAHPNVPLDSKRDVLSTHNSPLANACRLQMYSIRHSIQQTSSPGKKINSGSVTAGDSNSQIRG